MATPDGRPFVDATGGIGPAATIAPVGYLARELRDAIPAALRALGSASR